MPTRIKRPQLTKTDTRPSNPNTTALVGANTKIAMSSAYLYLLMNCNMISSKKHAFVQLNVLNVIITNGKTIFHVYPFAGGESVGPWRTLLEDNDLSPKKEVPQNHKILRNHLLRTYPTRYCLITGYGRSSWLLLIIPACGHYWPYYTSMRQRRP